MTQAPWNVAQTDSRTGWLVVDSRGRKAPGIIVFRRREAAQEMADLLNAQHAQGVGL